MTTAPARRRNRAPVIVALAAIALAAVAVVVWLVAFHEPSAVSVYPGNRVVAALPGTTIVVRGAAADDLGDLTVTGSVSGPHSGRWRPHPDGDGAAFVPDEPFAPEERVSVDAGRPITGADGNSTSFVIAPASDAPPPPFDDAPVPGDKGIHSFASRPDLRPPAVEVVTATPDAATDPVFVAPKRGASAQGPLILDGQGQPVWFHPLSGDDQAFDFRRQTLDGKPVLTWWQGRVALYRGYGTGRIVDTRYRPVATVRMGNGYRMDAHEFQLTSRGTALAIAYEAVPWDLSKLGGRRDGIVEDNVVQEIDVDSGAVLFEWHALGTIPLAESIRTAPKKRGQPHDPFHLNAVTLDRDGNFIISARHTSTIYKLDRDTGAILWRLGGKRSDYELGPGAEFHLQHDARRRADGAITLFDNVAEDLPARGRRSRGLALKLDDKAKTATVAQEFEHPGTVLSGTQGSMQSLDDGGAFVGWGGMQPWMTKFGADAAPDWDARFLAPKVESYRAYRLPWSGLGEGRPAAVVRGRRVFVSWNGATGVASWRVTPAGGAPVTAERTGFETEIALPRPAASVRVDALGADGEVLGRSG